MQLGRGGRRNERLHGVVVGIAGIENEHLDILSKIAIIFSDDDEVQKLVDASTAEQLHALLSEVNDS